MTSRTPLLPVDQQMRADAELGAAFRRATEAAKAAKLVGPRLARLRDGTYLAGVWRYERPHDKPVEARNDDPAAALDALTEALERRTT